MLRNEDDVHNAIDWWNNELEILERRPLRSWLKRGMGEGGKWKTYKHYVLGIVAALEWVAGDDRLYNITMKGIYKNSAQQK